MENLHLDRRSRYSQKMIRSALFELLEQKELKKITVTDICNLADVNRGTFYKYYHDVPDLLSKIMDSLSEKISDILEKNCRDHFSFDALYSNILSMLADNTDFNHFIRIDTMSCYTLIHKVIEAARPNLLQSMRTCMPALPEKDAGYVFDFILGGTAHIIMQWLEDDMRTPQSEMKQILINLIDLISQGVSTAHAPLDK